MNGEGELIDKDGNRKKCLYEDGMLINCES